MTLLIAALAMFSIPFVAVGLLGLRFWLDGRRQARDLDRALDRILSGRRPSGPPPEQREWRIG